MTADTKPTTGSTSPAEVEHEALLILISEILRDCESRLSALQADMSDLLVSGIEPSRFGRLQALDHVTQLMGSLAVLCRALASSVPNGPAIAPDILRALPILEEVRSKALRSAEGISEARQDVLPGTTEWL